MRRHCAVLLVAGVVLAAPAAAYADERADTGSASTPTPSTTPSTTTPDTSKSPTPEPTTPTPGPSDSSSTPSADPSRDSSAAPTNHEDTGPNGMPMLDAKDAEDAGGAEKHEGPAHPRLRVYDPIVVPGETLHVEGVGCRLGATAAVRGDGVVLGRLAVTKEATGGTLFKGDVTIPGTWADGPHELSATCGDVTVGSVRITVDKTTVEAFAEVSDTSVYPGQTIGFSGRCELEAPTVSVVDIATNTVLTEVECAADGRFSGKLTIPRSWVPGVEGSLGFACLGREGSTSAHRVDFTVVKKPGDGKDKGDDDKREGELQGGQLPFTGAAGLPLLLGLGGALLVAGGLLVAVRRRRPKAPSEDAPTS